MFKSSLSKMLLGELSSSECGKEEDDDADADGSDADDWRPSGRRRTVHRVAAPSAARIAGPRQPWQWRDGDDLPGQGSSSGQLGHDREGSPPWDTAERIPTRDPLVAAAGRAAAMPQIRGRSRRPHRPLLPIPSHIPAVQARRLIYQPNASSAKPKHLFLIESFPHVKAASWQQCGCLPQYPTQPIQYPKTMTIRKS